MAVAIDGAGRLVKRGLKRIGEALGVPSPQRALLARPFPGVN